MHLAGWKVSGEEGSVREVREGGRKLESVSRGEEKEERCHHRRKRRDKGEEEAWQVSGSVRAGTLVSGGDEGGHLSFSSSRPFLLTFLSRDTKDLNSPEVKDNPIILTNYPKQDSSAAIVG